MISQHVPLKARICEFFLSPPPPRVRRRTKDNFSHTIQGPWVRHHAKDNFSQEARTAPTVHLELVPPPRELFNYPWVRHQAMGNIPQEPSKGFVANRGQLHQPRVYQHLGPSSCHGQHPPGANTTSPLPTYFGETAGGAD